MPDDHDYCNMKKGRYPVSKRFFDLILVLVTLPLSLPLVLLTALLVRIKIGSPTIFRQQRPGLNEKPFTLHKFRTMSAEKDLDGNLLPDSERLSRFGKVLRATSLDELPELFCILKGEMSLVGPRPLLMQYLPLYNEFQKKRHLLPPGITGWAQVHGRNAIEWEDKFQYDVWYVENQTLWLDIKILFLTKSGK